MDALYQCGFKSRKVQLLIQPNEENNSTTSNKETVKFMCNKAKDSIAFINMEGSVYNTAVLHRKGILGYRFTIHRKALHSARCAEASNAVAEAAYKIIQLEKMKNPDGIMCNCGVIKGGTVANSVAENCWFLADIRFSTLKELEIVRKKVSKIAQLSYIEGCTCDIEEISFRPAMFDSEKMLCYLKI